MPRHCLGGMAHAGVAAPRGALFAAQHAPTLTALAATASTATMAGTFEVDMSKFKEVKVDPWANETLPADAKADLLANIELCRDAIVFFTACGSASGYGGHTGGAFDTMPEVMLLRSFFNARFASLDTLARTRARTHAQSHSLAHWFRAKGGAKSKSGDKAHSCAQSTDKGTPSRRHVDEQIHEDAWKGKTGVQCIAMSLS